jgi:putative endopeptidase
MRRLQVVLASGVSATLAVGAAAQTPQRPITELPYTPGLDTTAMDRSADPCADFYAYSCGGWQKNNPIPPDQPRWGVYGKLYNENLAFLWGLLEAAARPDPGRTPERQKIGDYFAACMDEPAVEQAGIKPLAAELEAIAALRSVDGLAALLGQLHPAYQGNGLLFAFVPGPDPKDSKHVIGHVRGGGLGLPDRDYYFKDDAKSKEIRARYQQHVAQMLGRLGDPPATAAANAAAIVRLETSLAEASLTRVERRDPYKTYHKMTPAELQALAPAFRFKDYFEGIHAPALAGLNVGQPKLWQRVEKLLTTESLDHWKAYLRWHLVSDKAPYLSKAFAEPAFDFYRRYLSGVPEMPPRWKDCVQYVDNDLGEALGHVYVEKVFRPESKASTLDMVKRIDEAMAVRLKGLPWMSALTKQQAEAKLRGMRNKIGYPDRWRDYTALEIRRGDFLGNVERSTAFETRRQLVRIGKAVDRDEWDMTPPTVNAYYDAQKNDINFPAGILLPPLYDPKMDDAPNYGNTGSTIGHELTHGFDDEGRKFDADGNLRDWWTAEDGKEFDRRAGCVADQYAQYTAVDDIKINSKLTLGEDIADLGGTILAYEAWRAANAGKPEAKRDGLSPEQRFFVGFAQWACANNRPEDLRRRAMTDPHSPERYRINGVVVNMPEFAQAFACKPGQPMVKPSDAVCRIW